MRRLVGSASAENTEDIVASRLATRLNMLDKRRPCQAYLTIQETIAYVGDAGVVACCCSDHRPTVVTRALSRRGIRA
jgi:hypothetical protein